MSSSTTDLLLMLFPNIIDRLNLLLTKFGSDFDHCREKSKKEKLPTSTNQALNTLLANFPHSYEAYSKCVDSFVDIGKNSPDSALSVLFTLLPNRLLSTNNNNNLYIEIRAAIQSYANHSDLFDLVFILFFADCTAHILTAETNTQFTSELFHLSYQMIEPYSESYEFPLRMSIVKQFSVIFGLLSINNLSPIVNNFLTTAPKSDPSLFFILHRFLRLHLSETVTRDQIGDLLTTFNKMNPNLKEFSKYFPNFKPKKSKDSKDTKDSNHTAGAMWALSLYSLASQLNVAGFPFFADILNDIYTSALPKATSKTPHIYHVMLCSSIIMRIQDNAKKNYNDFLNDVIFKKVKDKEGIKFLEQSLQGFLIIIRGHYCSRTTFFWEWGNFNAMWKPGVEATHLFMADQPQSNENSFTNLFFIHFGNLPIEQYPQIVSDILFNFASRDFKFFIQTTIPRLIETIGANNAISCLQNCIQMIIDPIRHFSEWAQENPLNQNIRIDITIPLLFNPLKVNIFSLISHLLPKSQMNKAYSFKLSDSTNFPRFSLPFQTDQFPSSVKKRIGFATLSVGNTLHDWQVNYSQSSFTLQTEINVVEQISEEESQLIKLLEFIPRILNASDVINDFGGDLLALFLSNSPAVSSFTIRIINQIFSAVDKSRIILYGRINKMIMKTVDPIHVFMLFQLLFKLFDLSLDPCCSLIQIQDFVRQLQPTILYLLTFPFTEIRDLTLTFITNLTKFCSVYKITIPFSQIFCKLDPTISAVARYNIIKYNQFYTDNSIKLNIPKSYITLREASLAQYEEVYRYFLIEISNTYCHLVDKKTLVTTIQQFISLLPEEPLNCVSEEFLHYSNMIDVIMHILPAHPTNQPMTQYLKNRLTPFYEFEYAINLSKSQEEELGSSIQSISKIMQSILNHLTASTDSSINQQTNGIVKLLQFMSAPIISTFLTPFVQLLKNKMNNIDLNEIDKKKDDLLDLSIQPFSSFMELATDIVVRISQSVDLNFSFLAYNESKQGFLDFIQIVETYLQDLDLTSKDSEIDFSIQADYTYSNSNLNSSGSQIQPTVQQTKSSTTNNGKLNIHHHKTQSFTSPSKKNLISRFKVGRGDIKIAMNYTEIVKNFADGLLVPQQPVNEGPFRSLDKDPWVSTNYGLEMRRKTFGILLNWAKFADPSYNLHHHNFDKSFAILGKKSLQAIGSLCRFAPMFDPEFPLTVYLERILISIESQYEQYLPLILSFHRDLLFDKFAYKMLTETSDLAPHYFTAIAHLYYNQIDDIFARKFGFSIESNVTLTVATIRKVRKNRTVSRIFSTTGFGEFETNLNDDEISINKELMKYASRIIVTCFVYLLSKNYSLRLTAFNLLNRILPIVVTIIQPDKPESVAILAKKYQTLSPIFNSQLATITPELVKKLSKQIAKHCPLLSDSIIIEVFDVITKSKDNSYLSLTNDGTLIRVLMPLFKLRINSFVESDDNQLTAYSLMTGLLQIGTKIDFANLNFYLSIWREYAAAGKNSLELIVEYLLDLTIEENKNYTSSIKIVLVELAKIDKEVVINSLVSRLTFAYWYYTTLEGKLKPSGDNKPLKNESSTDSDVESDDYDDSVANDNNQQNLPIPLNIQMYDRIILTLTEIAQLYFDGIVAHIPIIFNFCLLHYEQSNTNLTDLLLMIVANMQNCPDRFTTALVPPSSLIWPDNDTYNNTDFSLKQFTSSEIALQSFSKHPISVPSFVKSFQNYLRKTSKEAVANWAQEAARWASGCGELIIAGRACYILTEIIEPFNPKSLRPIVKSLSIVTQLKQNRDTHFYLVAVFHLFSAFFDKYNKHYRILEQSKNRRVTLAKRPETDKTVIPDDSSNSVSNSYSYEIVDDNGEDQVKHHSIKEQNNEEIITSDSESESSNEEEVPANTEDKQISESFMLLFQIAATFLSLSEDDTHSVIYGTLCQKALSIITSFTISSKCENCDIKKLLMRLSSLSATLEQKEPIYAAILAIFYRERNNSSSQISNIAFCAFLPFVFMALSAYHNIQPFSDEMNDDSIKEILQCLELIAETASCPVPVKMLIASLVSDPSSIDPFDFVLQTSIAFSNPHASIPSTLPNSESASAIFATVSNEDLIQRRIPPIATSTISLNATPRSSTHKLRKRNNLKQSDVEDQSKETVNSSEESGESVGEHIDRVVDSSEQVLNQPKEEEVESPLVRTSTQIKTLNFKEIVAKVAPYLCKEIACTNSDSAKSAIFAVVAAFLQTTNLTPENLALYSPIAKIAASCCSSSSQANEMLQLYLQRMPISIEVPSNLPKRNSAQVRKASSQNNETIRKSSTVPETLQLNGDEQSLIENSLNYSSLETSNVPKKLLEITSELEFDIPQGDSYLENCIVIVPIDSIENWDSEFSKTIKSQLSSIRVVGYPFVTKNRSNLNLKSLKSGKLDEIPIPTENHLYYSYISMMKKMK